MSGKKKSALPLLINLAGKMRMLSHRTVMGLALAAGARITELRQRYIRMAEEALHEFGENGQVLIDGCSATDIPKLFSERAKVLLYGTTTGYAGLFQSYQEDADACLRLLKAEKAVDHSALVALSDMVAGDVLNSLNELVTAFSADLKEIVDEDQRQADAVNSAIAEASLEIGTIGSQVEIIAFNALIEASRAGIQGRAFAVIANEVKDLALRTKASAERVEANSRSLCRNNG